MPKRFNLGNEGVVETPPLSPVPEGRPRGLKLPTTAMPSIPEPAERHPRVLTSVEPGPPPVEAPVVPVRRPKTLVVPEGIVTHQRVQRDKTVTDTLIDRAVIADPDISTGRIRGRIDTLLSIKTEDLIRWGEVNLTPLQSASAIQAEIAADLTRINVVNLLTEAKNAACALPTLFDRITGKGKPEQIEQMLRNAKTMLSELLVKADQHRKDFAPEVVDLHLDAISLTVTLAEFSDPVIMNIANSRAKTLILSHQTGTMLLTVLENTVAQCAQYMEQIDSMLSVTIPQWKMAYQKK